MTTDLSDSPPPSTYISRLHRQATEGLVLVLAAVVRLTDLSLKPLHSDEAVNGLFLTRLFREGYYRYDPANYHGPTLYYAGLVTSTIGALFHGRHGLSTIAIRLVPVVFGVATVWLVLQLRRNLTDRGAFIAGLLIAVSPGAVYFSRDFIHETMFVFFTLAAVVGVLRFREQHKPKYLFVASASAALAACTKETWVISLAVLVIAAMASHYLSSHAEPSRAKRGNPISRRAALTAILVFLSVFVLFYSSFFTQADGPWMGVDTYRYWFHTGQSSHRAAGDTYLRLLGRMELPILLLGATGVSLCFLGGRDRFALFVSCWAIGLLSVYSLLPYKTPWLALNFIVPLAIVGGYAVSHLERTIRRPFATPLLNVLLAGVLFWSLFECVRLNFSAYDDDRIPYVYVQTNRDFMRIVQDIQSTAAANGTFDKTTLSIVCPDHWPLSWYLRDFPNAGFYGHPIAPHEAMVVGCGSQESLLKPLLGNDYERVGAYAARPGVELVLYRRRQP
jgi:uncharacterized protein (TIGR03663 family)